MATARCGETGSCRNGRVSELPVQGSIHAEEREESKWEPGVRPTAHSAVRRADAGSRHVSGKVCEDSSRDVSASKYPMTRTFLLVIRSICLVSDNTNITNHGGAK